MNLRSLRQTNLTRSTIQSYRIGPYRISSFCYKLGDIRVHGPGGRSHRSFSNSEVVCHDVQILIPRITNALNSVLQREREPHTLSSSIIAVSPQPQYHFGLVPDQPVNMALKVVRYVDGVEFSLVESRAGHLGRPADISACIPAFSLTLLGQCGRGVAVRWLHRGVRG